VWRLQHKRINLFVFLNLSYILFLPNPLITGTVNLQWHQWFIIRNRNRIVEVDIALLITALKGRRATGGFDDERLELDLTYLLRSCVVAEHCLTYRVPRWAYVYCDLICKSWIKLVSNWPVTAFLWWNTSAGYRSAETCGAPCTTARLRGQVQCPRFSTSKTKGTETSWHEENSAQSPAVDQSRTNQPNQEDSQRVTFFHNKRRLRNDVHHTWPQSVTSPSAAMAVKPPVDRDQQYPKLCICGRP